MYHSKEDWLEKIKKKTRIFLKSTIFHTMFFIQRQKNDTTFHLTLYTIVTPVTIFENISQRWILDNIFKEWSHLKKKINLHHRQTTLNFRNFLQIQISLSFFSSFLKLEKKLIQHDYQHDSFRQNYQINLIVFRVGCTPLKKGVEKEVVWHSLRVSNLFGFLDRHRITVEIDVEDSLQTCPIQEEKDQFPSEIPAFPPSFPSSRFTISHRGIECQL